MKKSVTTWRLKYATDLAVETVSQGNGIHREVEAKVSSVQNLGLTNRNCINGTLEKVVVLLRVAEYLHTP